MSSGQTVSDTAASPGDDEKVRSPLRSERDREIAEELVERASKDGVNLVGPDGLPTGVTKRVLEAGLEAEITEHLGYEKHDPEGRNGENSRNGTRPKTGTTVGAVGHEAVAQGRSGARSARSSMIGFVN